MMRSLCFALAGACAAFDTSAAQGGYTFTILAPFEGYEARLQTAPPPSHATAINNAGQIVGWSNLADNLSSHAALWNGSVPAAIPTDLGGGRFSMASAINDVGQIVGSGTFSTTPSTTSHAALWSGGTVIDLGTLGGSADALGINNAGKIVGSGLTTDGGRFPVVWSVTPPMILDRLGAPYGIALGINNLDQAVGNSSTVGPGNAKPLLWNGTSATPLGTLGGDITYAVAINDLGQIVGYDNGPNHAVIWNGFTPTDLAPSGDYFSSASDINNFGQVVGRSRAIDGPLHAEMWDANGAVDLNTLLSQDAIDAGWHLADAYGINDSGWIIGAASNDRLGTGWSFLLSTGGGVDTFPVPVPEPQTYALLGVGLGVLALRRRQIKSRHV